MKEKIKVICKKLKNKLPLLLACLLVGAMVLGLYVFSQSKQVNTLSASAEEASTVAETASDVESGIDLTQYPSANLLHLLDKKIDSVAGNVVVSTSFSGKVSIKGTATQGGGRTYFFSEPVYLEAGKTYTKSRVEGYSGLLYLTMQSNISKTISGFIDTFTVDTSGYYCLGFNMEQGKTYDLEFYPMLNVGDTLYPFTPNLNAIYNGGYNAGYDVGETDGKEIGYSDGLDKARAGYWNDSKVYVNLNGTSNGVTVNRYLEITPTITSNGVDLSNVYTEINAQYPNFISTNTTFGFEFVSPVYFDGLNVRCIGDTSVLVDREMIAIVYDPKTKKESGVDCRFILIDGSDNVAGFHTATTREELFGKQLKLFGTFTVQNISQFKNMRFYSNEVIANLNYQAGYQAGVLDNTLYQKGYDKGFELGEKKGFDEGVIKGQTNDPYDLGDFFFSIIDAPFRIIREALNFEFLGFNVSEILFFIITISLFAFVLKYIRGA